VGVPTCSEPKGPCQWQPLLHHLCSYWASDPRIFCSAATLSFLLPQAHLFDFSLHPTPTIRDPKVEIPGGLQDQAWVTFLMGMAMSCTNSGFGGLSQSHTRDTSLHHTCPPLAETASLEVDNTTLIIGHDFSESFLS
jgi:hypothetical protein